ncbi:MAG: ABC transporter permease, partial [Nevskiales bacterium]
MRHLLRGFIYLVVLLMTLPTLITLTVAITPTSFITFPPPGFSLKWFAAILDDAPLLDSIRRSLLLAVVVALVTLAISLPCAFVVGRAGTRRHNTLETFISSPQMVPQIVLVLGLLIFYEAAGLAESFIGLVISH